MTNEWFTVDRKGLSKLMAGKPKDFVLYELLQNAWDENVTTVAMTLERIAGTPNVRLVVEDDSPDGFADLTHAYSMFAESAKKGVANRRGRYNAGEKLALSLASEATILSTKGGVRFDADGRHLLRKRRAVGSQVSVVLRMTTKEIEECVAAVGRLIPPAGIATLFNGEPLVHRVALATPEATLPTEIGDAEGVLMRTRRRTRIEIHQPRDGEAGMIHEMGIPVVENGCRWSVDIGQKVPLNMARDNVTPAYLADVRALLLECMTPSLSVEDANAPWVREAVAAHGQTLPAETIERLATLRFGEKRVVFDPSDPEANLRAAAQGVTVVHGSQLGRNEWDAVRRAGAIRPAGQVTPSPKPYSEDGTPLRPLARETWTPRMKAVVAYFDRIAPRLIGMAVAPTRIVSDVTWPFVATYGPHSGLVPNLGRLGHRWFDGPREPMTELFLHELGHHYSPSHLSPGYHDALTQLGSKLVDMALSEPALFELEPVECTC